MSSLKSPRNVSTSMSRCALPSPSWRLWTPLHCASRPIASAPLPLDAEHVAIGTAFSVVDTDLERLAVCVGGMFADLNASPPRLFLDRPSDAGASADRPATLNLLIPHR